MRRLALLLPLLVCAALWAVLPLGAPASKIDKIRHQIHQTQERLQGTQARAHVLSTTISSFTQRIDRLQGSITTLQQRQNAIQADLDAKRAQLARIQSQLRVERAKLAKLRARLAYARKILAQRLVQLYESDQPDLVSVVLNSHDFSNLVEQNTYLRNIGQQDRQIIEAVRAARAETAAATARLGRLEQTYEQVAAAILARRNEVAGVRIQLQQRRDAYADVRSRKQRALDSVRAHAAELRQHVDYLQSEQDRIEAEIRAAQARAAAASSGGAALPAGPIRGGGRFIWPVNGPITSPFCERRAWEACHPGIDIGVPSGTPIRAAGTGTVAIAGWVSGYGNYTCIDHGGGISTCYGHQSSLGVSVGQHVTQGQIIGLTGCTGLCFGPHLHFEVRINGAVTNPLSYLG